MARMVGVKDTGLGVGLIAVPDTTNGGYQAREKADQRGNETGRKSANNQHHPTIMQKSNPAIGTL
ncbi:MULTISPECIES: hypothetical protein [unclassified Martelella]|uniref:hypothetical protein n=1 Tax=unclassified Martelella TaxID=2629616 RepID=UPI0025C11C1E|nr:hypothetical protein [Martelella sp.]